MVFHVPYLNFFMNVSDLIQSLCLYSLVDYEHMELLCYDSSWVALLASIYLDNVICVCSWLFVHNLMPLINPFCVMVMCCIYTHDGFWFLYRKGLIFCAKGNELTVIGLLGFSDLSNVYIYFILFVWGYANILRWGRRYDIISCHFRCLRQGKYARIRCFMWDMTCFVFSLA